MFSQHPVGVHFISLGTVLLLGASCCKGSFLIPFLDKQESDSGERCA